MHLSSAVGRKKSSVIGLHDELCTVLPVVGRIHILHNTAPVVTRTDDTTVAVLHAVLQHELGYQSHTMVTGQRSISEQVRQNCFFF